MALHEVDKRLPPAFGDHYVGIEKNGVGIARTGIYGPVVAFCESVVLLKFNNLDLGEVTAQPVYRPVCTAVVCHYKIRLRRHSSADGLGNKLLQKVKSVPVENYYRKFFHDGTADKVSDSEG